MLYPKNQSPRLEDGLFLNPSCEYRGAPFWAWNGKLSRETLTRQIDMLHKMGMGGFHMHVRTGMDSPYLDEEFMGYIRHCVDKAEKDQMLAWLYDEDRWPSGTAGGKITAAHPDYARKTLLFTHTPYAPDRPHRAQKPEPGRGQESMRQDNGVLIAVYDVLLNPDGTLKSARRTDIQTPARGQKWYAYMESAADDPWFNNHPYVDTLKPEAIRAFIETTHEAYLRAVGPEFGKTIPAIFTDEPQFTPKDTLDFPLEQKDIFLPWTDDLPDLYEAAYGEPMLDKLPELIWELPENRISRFRYRFHNLVAERFSAAYCAQIGDWCRDHGIALTGHVMGEPTLESQTLAVGDAMRCYPSFGIPGIDMLCDFHEYNTAKQTQSMVHQMGNEAMLSELYGVTGWDYDFRGYKLQGDWQAALGVTVRVPHLTWMTMKGEAKRDYPASIGYQSPWWDQFSMVENHFARLNTALTRGKPRVRVAVVHPIESYWLYWGPSEQTAALRNNLENQFAQLTECLLFGLIDFDFICEARFAAQCPKAQNPLKVGQMEYDAVIVCSSRTLRSTTLKRLDDFERQGGRLIFVGDCPDLVDAEPSGAVRPLFERAVRVGFDPLAILDVLEDLRMLEIRDQSGRRTDRLIHQWRKDRENEWLFIANGKNPDCPDVDPAPVLRFSLQGEYRLTEYDTLSGAIRPLGAVYQNGRTLFERPWHMHDSLLLRLEPGRSSQPVLSLIRGQKSPISLMTPVKISLDEPNMLLLDMAEYALNGGAYRPMEELLRLDNRARAELGIPLRRKEVLQPYLIAPEQFENFLSLRFRIPSECEVSAPLLGLEDLDLTQIRFNGVEVEPKAVGWYVDRCIQTVALPPIHPGENILEIQTPIGRRTNLECYYLLGDFGVRVNGVQKTVIPPVKTLGFGDIVSQGLPFYTGNVNYFFEIEADGPMTLRVPRYRGGLVKVFMDGKEQGNIAFSPYAMDLNPSPGRHEICLKLYGVRQNGFAQLHHTPGVYFYQSPNSWRSAGDLWCYEYQFKPMGILKSPLLYGLEGGSDADHITDRS